MIIGIDGNEANVTNRVGSNQYAYGIINGLATLKTADDIRYIIYLKHKPVTDMPPAKPPSWRYRVLPPAIAWTQWRLPLDLIKPWGRPDIFYSPGHYAPRFSSIPTVVSIMDLAFLKMPQLFLRFKKGAQQLASWTEYSVKQASAIIAISEHTKQDLVDLYHLNPNLIHVAYPGVDHMYFRPAAVPQIKKMKQTYHLPEKYILHLGTLQPRKNIVRLIKAFESLPAKYRKYHLVLAGGAGWLTGDIETAIQESSKQDQILRSGYVTSPDLPALITGASCVATVGLYEGFGMPPAEAFACGTIPVVSNNTSLPEVVGRAGILVDPYSVASITHGIIAALDLDDDQKQERLKMGREHIKKFDWHTSAQVVLEVLKNYVV